MSWSARLKTPTKPAPPAPKTPTSSRKVQDENKKPVSLTTDALNGHSKKLNGVSCNIMNKRIKDDASCSTENLTALTPKTPLQPSSTTNKCRTPLASRKTPNSTNRPATPGAKASGNVTPKTSKSGRGQTRTTPTKFERSTSRSVLVEFSDDVFTTPNRRLLSDQGTPTVSVKTSSTISIHHEPIVSRNESPQGNSSLNRSRSASSLSCSRSSSDNPANNGNTILRSRSEAKLFSLATEVFPLEDSSESSRVIVGARVRPLHPREPGNSVFVTANEVRVASDLGSVHRFSFDFCFPASGPEMSSQEDVYETLVKPLVDTAFQGYNACLFAYGQTGSGKTYSMMGPMHANDELTPESGIIPRFCREVLARVSALDMSASEQPHPQAESSVTTTVEISYLEVYNEKIHDLLVPGSNQLKVREHPVYGPYVVDLTKHTTSNYNELQRWINIGNQKRATAATEMNDKSSRSHSLFTVILTQTFAQVGSDGLWSHDQTRRSQINLVDLAGSERIAHTSVTSDRLREGVSINKSLLTLGKVMTALIEKRSHVPYRDSVLTWLLKESLGGNSRTTMLATISPSGAHIEETLSTLRYASQARSIVNTVRVNEAPQDKLIRELRAEINKLREMGTDHERVQRPLSDYAHQENSSQIHRLQDDLDQKSKRLIEAENQLSAVLSEKKDLALKLSEYMENNKQLASKCASGIKDVKSFNGEERACLVDELVNLKEQHNSLKKHYLALQDELEYEKGSKYQLMCEKESDAGLIASLKSKVEQFESELLLEKNEIALKDAALSKLRKEMEEVQLAQDSLATTFLLKEEFCNAQAIAEIEKNELVQAKDEKIRELESRLEKCTKGLSAVVNELSRVGFVERKFDPADVDSINVLCTQIKERLDSLSTENEQLRRNDEKNRNELRDSLEKSLHNELTWKNKYEDTLRSKYDLEDEKKRLVETVEDLQAAKESVEEECKRLKEEMNFAEIYGESATDEIEKKKSEIAALESELTSLRENHTSSTGSLKKLVTELETKLDVLESERHKTDSEKTSELVRLRLEIDRLKNMEHKLRSAEEESRALKKEHAVKVEKLTEEINKMREISSQRLAKLECADERFDRLKEETEALKDLNAELKSKCSICEEAVTKLENECGELKRINGELKSEKIALSTAESDEIVKLKAEIQGLQERNRLLKKRARKSKLPSVSADDSKKLKTEISQLRKINKNVVTELEKVRGLGSMVPTGAVDSLLQKAKEEVAAAAAENKVLKSENTTLDKRASKVIIENESLREQVAKLEKEKADMFEKLNCISGEKSVTDYKLRMSLVNHKSIEDQEEKLKRVQDKNDELKEACALHMSRLAELEHQLSLSKLGEETVKNELNSKMKLLDDVRNEVKTAQKMQRELMEEKLALVKVMEKHFNDESFEDKQSVISENASLKKELQLSQQRMEQKIERITTLGQRVSELEILLVKVIDGTFRNQLELEDMRAAIVNKDYSAFDLLMGLYLPHHFEYLVRKARTLTEKFQIPYDIDFSSSNSKVIVKHMILTALATFNRTMLDKWIANIEEKNAWSPADDKELPWKVDMDTFISQCKSRSAENQGVSSDATDSSALSLGVKKRADGSLDPVEWRRMLIQRHVRGMKDDYTVLIKYFGNEGDSAVYAILERIRTSVDRLEQVTSNSSIVDNISQ